MVEILVTLFVFVKFLFSFFFWSRACFLSFFLTFLFSFINSHLRGENRTHEKKGRMGEWKNGGMEEFLGCTRMWKIWMPRHGLGSQISELFPFFHFSVFSRGFGFHLSVFYESEWLDWIRLACPYWSLSACSLHERTSSGNSKQADVHWGQFSACFLLGTINC